MKYAIIALALVSTTAFARSQESYLAEICSLKAEHAVRVAKLARQGYPWAELEKSLIQGGVKKDVDLTYLRTAYYQYSVLDDQSIRSLTYSDCRIADLKERLHK